MPDTNPTTPPPVPAPGALPTPATKSAKPQYGSVSIIQCPAVSRKPLEEGHRQFQKGLN